MEPITHFLSGAVLARSGFNRKTAYATVAMTLAAEMPDLDVLWGLRGPVAGFQHHRGITHTFLGAPFEGLVVVLVMWCVERIRQRKRRFRPELPARWGWVWLLSTMAVLLHILLDYTNNYGVRPFYPFSPRWWAWSTVFIVDPFLLLVFSLALLLPALLGLADREMTRRRKPFRGKGWAIGALVLVALYYGLRSAERTHAIRLTRVNHVGIAPLEAASKSLDEPVIRIAAEPYPFNPFHWHTIVETANWYQTAEVFSSTDLVTTSDQNSRIYKPPVTDAVRAAKQSWLGRVYLSWAKFPVTQDAGIESLPGESGGQNSGLTRVNFEDLRFAYAALPGANEGPAPLSAHAYLDAAGKTVAMYLGDREQKGHDPGKPPGH